MDPKYELLPSEIPGLHRIRALRDFGDVRAGDIGGLIENESNLSHYGNAHVAGNAQVSDNARVSGNARVYGDAHVYGDAWVSGDSHVSGNARVSDNAWVYGNAHVYGDAHVHGDARVCGDARVRDDASICWFSHVGRENGTLTAFTAERGIYCTRGCFEGTLDEFEAAVRETHGENQIAQEYALLIEFIQLRLGWAGRS